MFHAVFAADPDPTIWDAWLDYLAANTALYSVAQNSPVANLGLPDGRWAVRVSTAWDYANSPNDVAAGAALASRINGLTGAGRHVLVDEIHGGHGGYDPIPMCTIAIGSLNDPELVHFYVSSGRHISYDDLDASDIFPVLTTALMGGVGLLLEMYIPQPQAEASGDVSQFISNWYLGPGGSRMPYLLALATELQTTSKIRFVYPVVDRFFKGERKIKLTRGKFMDLVLQRGIRSYPNEFNNGFCTWIWDSRRLHVPTRAADMVALHKHYTTGEGFVSGGAVRFYAASRA